VRKPATPKFDGEEEELLKGYYNQRAYQRGFEVAYLEAKNILI
jgi:hypothetical protein